MANRVSTTDQEKNQASPVDRTSQNTVANNFRQNAPGHNSVPGAKPVQSAEKAVPTLGDSASGDTPPPTTEGVTSTENHHTIEQRITRKRDLYVMMPYTRPNEPNYTSFIRAAAFKTKRIQKAHPNAEIWTRKFSIDEDIKKIWAEIYQATSIKDARYRIQEIHLFCHGNYNSIYTAENPSTKSIRFSYDDVNALEKLKWLPTSALVLHSCQASRWEGQPKADWNSRKCIAKALSYAQKTKVVGQVVFAIFNTGGGADNFEYRNNAMINYLLVDIARNGNLTLWGYKAGESIETHFANDPEYSALGKNQIWPCRCFVNGVEILRFVAKDLFSPDDLNYI
ncbi:MAG: hypothetical protein LBV45_02405 [Xanthomonadaceae bacterium]|jgi:hypothetical protein|nr:hypothetical protein [Xanthomonadaceae bacterium]